MSGRRWSVVALVLIAVLATGCSASPSSVVGSGSPVSNSPAAAQSSVPSGTLVLYTCASENVEQAVIAAFNRRYSAVKVQVFRAATGPLNAKIASDIRTGGIQADVIWACDPLTMHNYDQQHLLAAWSPPNAADIPASYRTAHFTGIDVLYMVLAVKSGTPAPVAWSDLTRAAYQDAVVIPNPNFAASALGALGYFSTASGYGLAYYRKLKANGGVQVDSPADSLAGVEQGRYLAGMTLANAAYLDQRKGSPIQVVWPAPGAIAIYAPIGVTTKPGRSPVAVDFAAFAASAAGQQAMAGQNTYVTLPSVKGAPPLPAGSPITAPDWTSLFGSAVAIQKEYSAIFTG